MSVCASPVTIDVRKIAPEHRPAMIFAAFNLLRAGDALELVSDRDPKTLRVQFESDQPGRFSWVALEQGPAAWRVAITRIKAGHGTGGGCCGGCGGA
jgi:uncharacterized protein (DUF2249 family)